MMRVTIFFVIISFFGNTALAQTREELEKQRQQLKREIDETQKLLNSNKQVTKQSLTTLSLYINKVNLQDRVIENIGKDLHILDNNIYSIQKDVNKFDRLLDTLKQEYAKSMVYSYKNRGNYEFLNFIFSADNFNDAIKRISYLKSYRTYREMQGQNILRTQELRKKRLEDLGVSKKTKSVTLQVQSKEMSELEKQKAEQDKVVVQLKKEGSGLNARIAAKQKQIAKVNNAMKAAIAKALKEANDAKIAEEKAAKKRRDDLAAAEKNRKAEDTRNTKTAAASTTPGKTTTEPIKTRIVKEPVAIVVPASTTFNADNIALNNSFERNRGSLPWPVDNGAVLNHYGPIKLPSGATLDNSAVTISSAIGTPVKAVFDGTIILITEVDDGKYLVTVKHGNYFTSYSNINGVSIKMNQEIKTGQVLGRVACNRDGICSIDFYTAKSNTDLDPEKWLRRR
ncbi:MAG: peptidoglycan DD-metalloendopeptidase family protein [Ferruginibacter sp.]|nr:peptidoglycan DD-metalloendopeptidase family protein [Ferruginibacter sp.]